jgi:hypothetical protein
MFLIFLTSVASFWLSQYFTLERGGGLYRGEFMSARFIADVVQAWNLLLLVSRWVVKVGRSRRKFFNQFGWVGLLRFTEGGFVDDEFFDKGVGYPAGIAVPSADQYTDKIKIWEAHE